MAVTNDLDPTTPAFGIDYAASAVQSTLTAMTVAPHRRTLAHLAAPLVPAAFAVVREVSIPDKDQRKLVNVAAPIAFGLIGLGALALTSYGLRPRRYRW